MTKPWAVTVWHGSAEIVTIENNHLPICIPSGEIQDDDKEVIRAAARHLLVFVGDSFVETNLTQTLSDERASLREQLAATLDALTKAFDAAIDAQQLRGIAGEISKDPQKS